MMDDKRERNIKVEKIRFYPKQFSLPNRVQDASRKRDPKFTIPEEIGMKNEECVIYIVSKTGKVLQSYRRMKDGWTQTSSKGIVRHCSAEQLLSHILPPLAGVSSARVKVEKL